MAERNEDSGNFEPTEKNLEDAKQTGDNVKEAESHGLDSTEDVNKTVQGDQKD